MTRWAAVGLTLTLSLSAPAAGQTRAAAGGAVWDALQRLGAARAFVEAELGTGEAAAFQRRLFDDLERPHDPIPDGYTPEQWEETAAGIARLDVEATDQLVAGTATSLRAVPGLHEYLVPSRIDHRWQLVAMYVPASAPATRAPLAIVLHGNPQTEAELLAQAELRRVADATGTIVVAPFGRGIYDFAEPAASDVYDLLDALQRALPVDRGRTYLAGYSMGGFSVFKIGPRGGYRWRAVMCISGAILNSGVRAVDLAWHDMPLYVVTGAHDDSIPTKYGEQTAGFLAGIGLPVSFYEEPNGSHALRTLIPSLQRAWTDMLAGTEHPESVPANRGGTGLPPAIPAAKVKT
ncbi:MAG TPA: hypothetical protein VHT05_02735 [Candidatus Elarobacter sp.]|nr:hypothetical protein [Candidatus Elarobacter sp.]